MPSRAKMLDRSVSRLPSIPNELVGQFLIGPMTGEAINAAGIALKQALIEASLNAELMLLLATRRSRTGRRPRSTTATASDRQDGPDRRRKDADHDAARPLRQFRPFSAVQVCPPVHGARRQHRGFIRARSDNRRCRLSTSSSGYVAPLQD